jgi:hypothetical protein
MKLLNEIVDTTYPYKKKKQYLRQAHNYEFKSPHDNYEVEIHHVGAGEKTAMASFYSDKGGDDKSGSERNSAGRVFSTVKKILHQHVKDHPEIESVHFHSKSDNDREGRTKLYARMLNRATKSHEEKKTNGYYKLSAKVSDMKEGK